jgi:hypothetical protein
MPQARFTIDESALYGLLVLNDAEIARVVSAFEMIAADPPAAAQHTRRTRHGRTIYLHRLRGFEIAYAFNESLNRVWIVDLHPTRG